MKKRLIRDGVFLMGAVDWNRRLFDSLIPLPEGTSYNAYLVEGSEKTALIDTADPELEHVLLAQLEDVKKIDYIISLHTEQDHSGAIPTLLDMYPEARVVCSPKAKELLQDHLHIDEGVIDAMGDGQSLSLGDRTFTFIHTPWVHWPDTMLTYLREERVLFSCDFLGSHLATSDLFVRDTEEWRRAAKRYYAEIMMPFRNSIKGYLEKVRGLAPRMICPSHGPLHDDPELVLSAYDGWVSDEVKNEVVIAYASMHGSTRAMVEHLVDALIERGVRVRQIHVPSTELGELAMALVDPATIVIAAPTVLFGPHPAVVTAAYLTNALKPKARFATVMTSYGWGGRSVEILKGMLGQLKVEFLDPVQVKGYPTAETMESIRVLADTIRDRHKATTADYIGPA